MRFAEAKQRVIVVTVCLSKGITSDEAAYSTLLNKLNIVLLVFHFLIQAKIGLKAPSSDKWEDLNSHEKGKNI